MTTTAPSLAATDRPVSRAHHRRLVAALAVTQTVGYGVLFYAFPVLLVPIAADLRTSTAAVTCAATLSILVAASAALPVGRWLDRHGGRALMTGGSLLGVAAVLVWSQAHTIGQLYAVFVLIGLAGAASLYEAAFPVLIAVTHPARRDPALLAVTIVAGFASSIFFPLTGFLLAQHGWRSTLIILAGLLAVTAIPAHLWAVPARRTHHATAHDRRVTLARAGAPVAAAALGVGRFLPWAAAACLLAAAVLWTARTTDPPRLTVRTVTHYLLSQ